MSRECSGRWAAGSATERGGQCTFLEAGALLHVVAPRGEAGEHRAAAGTGEDSRLRLGIGITLTLEQATIAAISDTATVGRSTTATVASGDGGCPLLFLNAAAGHARLGGGQLRFLDPVVWHVSATDEQTRDGRREKPRDACLDLVSDSAEVGDA